jgi:hypothetical protein
MPIDFVEVGQMVYLVFNDENIYRIIQAQVRTVSASFEDDEMIQDIRVTTMGKYSKLTDAITIKNNVENEAMVKTFKEAFEICDGCNPLYFNDFAGSETLLREKV